MQMQHNTAGTSWSRAASLEHYHCVLVSHTGCLCEIGKDPVHVGPLTYSWDQLLDKATQVEWVALKRLRQGLAENEVSDELPAESCSKADCHSHTVCTTSTHRRISRLRQLQAILRAKLLRRLDAEGRGRTRLSLTGSFNCLTRETGSAAATARRMFPLGAPPAGA
jgi:hypothetical protein